jgi:streptomycin 6-kinase
MTLPMPTRLVDAATGDGRASWLAALPTVINDLCVRWSLTVGEPFQPGGTTSWVGPAIDAAGKRLVLKVGWRHPEAEHEAAGLRFWDGDGTVQLLADQRSADTMALLVERCEPGTPLCHLAEPAQDVILVGLMERLWSEPPPGAGFRPLTEMCEQWADEFEHRMTATPGAGLDPGLARAGIELFRCLPRSASRQVLLCTDLHAGNVLAARRQPWLVIDPKPYVGDPAYDPVQHLLNCDERLRADPVSLARRIADLIDVDAERLLQWLFARCVQESLDWPHLADVAGRISPS